MRILTLTFSALLVACTYSNSSGLDPWATFVGAPSPGNERELMNGIVSDLGKCGWGEAENKIVVPDEFRPQLFQQIANGNAPSFRIGLQIEKCLDGGDLGDFRRSAGQFFDRKPDEFLQQIIASEVPLESYKSLLTKLPLTLVDNVDGQNELIRSRIRKLSEITESKYADIKAVGVQSLREQERSLAN